MKHITTLLLAAAITWLSPATRAADGFVGSFKGPLGLQLYSLREQFKTDVPGTLAKVKALGFTEVELAGTYGKSPEEFSALLKANGLKAIAGHYGYNQLKNNPEAVVKEAKALGLEYVGTAGVPHSGQVTEAWVHETAKGFNQIGEALARHGIKFYYHNHGYEFVPHGDGTLFDLLVQETDPKYVSFQMDVMWTVFPGQDPVKLMEKHGSRWVLMHVKDLKKGVATGSLSGGTDARNDVVVGTGQTDWPALLRAAKKAGVKHYFIEDESPTVLEQIPQSVKYLKQVKF